MKPILGTQLNRGHRLANGLVGCWLLNEGGGGVVADLSGNVNSLALTGGSSWQAGDVVCDGLDGILLKSGFNFSRGAGDSTFELIVNLESYGEADNGYMMTFNDGTMLICQPTGGIRYRRQYSITYGTCRYTSDLGLIGKWSHVVVVDKTGELIDLYIDGKLISSLAWLTPPDGTKVDLDGTSFGLGSNTTVSRAMDGSIRKSAVYNRALSPGEIQDLYRDPYQMFKADPLALWVAATSGAAGSTFNPAWARHCNNIIGAA